MHTRDFVTFIAGTNVALLQISDIKRQQTAAFVLEYQLQKMNGGLPMPFCIFHLPFYLPNVVRPYVATSCHTRVATLRG